MLIILFKSVQKLSPTAEVTPEIHPSVLMGSFCLSPSPKQNKLPTPSPVYIILLLRVTGPTSYFSLPTCRCCWVNWEQFWEVKWPRKKGGWGASIAESGPGWRNFWVTLKSMRGYPCIDDESLLLTTAEGLWEEKKKAQIGGKVSLL